MVTHFDGPPERWLAGHLGADLQSTLGAAVFAPASGRVAFSGSVAGRPLLSIDHADGVRTSYEPVAAEVTAGQEVEAGQIIGYLVEDPRLDSDVAGVHASGILHWGARSTVEGQWSYFDPMTLVYVPVIRLLPV